MAPRRHKVVQGVSHPQRDPPADPHEHAQPRPVQHFGGAQHGLALVVADAARGVDEENALAQQLRATAGVAQRGTALGLLRRVADAVVGVDAVAVVVSLVSV